LDTISDKGESTECATGALIKAHIFDNIFEFAYHTDFTVITANVQAAAQDIPVRAVVFLTSLLHCLRHDFLCFNFFDIVTCRSSLRTKCHVNLFPFE